MRKTVVFIVVIFYLAYVDVNIANPLRAPALRAPSYIRGDVAMVMRAGNMDLRKLADGSGGGLPQSKVRKYASEMASVMR